MKAFHAKCVEPRKRNKDGKKWIVHRFPIKGGISIREAMIKDMAEPNLLWKLLVEDGNSIGEEGRRDDADTARDHRRPCGLVSDPGLLLD